MSFTQNTAVLGKKCVSSVLLNFFEVSKKKSLGCKNHWIKVHLLYRYDEGLVLCCVLLVYCCCWLENAAPWWWVTDEAPGTVAGSSDGATSCWRWPPLTPARGPCSPEPWEAAEDPRGGGGELWWCSAPWPRLNPSGEFPPRLVNLDLK